MVSQQVIKEELRQTMMLTIHSVSNLDSVWRVIGMAIQRVVRLFSRLSDVGNIPEHSGFVQ